MHATNFLAKFYIFRISVFYSCLYGFSLYTEYMKKEYAIGFGLLIAALIPSVLFVFKSKHKPATGSYPVSPIAEFINTNTVVNVLPAVSSNTDCTNPITSSDCSYRVGISTNWASR